jgi:S-formylglutathione hydrolase FrmB
MKRSVARFGAALVLSLALAPAAQADGLRVVTERRLDPRLVELTLRSTAVAGPTAVRVLLPSGYAGSTRRYPVLYLLHGAASDYRAWTAAGDAERLTPGRALIVVMPDSGAKGGYVDWFNAGLGGPPRWESYHVAQLVPFIDRRYRTLPSRGRRAIAGLSMGGFGTMAYAARHPDLFGFAAAFSGAVDTNNVLYQSVTSDAVFGPRATQEIRWRGSNPWDLADNLRHTQLVLRTGNGGPGGPFGGGDIVEEVVHQMNASFHDRLRRLGIPHLWDDYGPGGHMWAYWRRDLHETLPLLMRAFAGPVVAPRSFSFRAIEPRYAVWGWRAAVRRRALEFSELRSAGAAGFTFRGSGRATVTTAPLYRPAAVLIATLRSAAGTHRRTVRADRSGRVTLAFELGRSNPRPEHSPGARTAVFSTRVSLAPR